MIQDPYTETEEDFSEQEDSSSVNTALLDQMGHESIKFLLDSSNILNNISKRLTSLQTKYAGKNGCIDKNSFKQIGDLKEEILLLLEPITSRAIYLSDLEEEQVYNISYELNKAIIKQVFEKGDMLTHADKKTIIALCYAVIFASLRRPFKGGERGLLSKTQQVRELIQKLSGKQQQKGGWKALFSKF